MQTAKSFTRQRMPRCFSQSRIIGPKYGEPHNQRCNLGDEREKQPPASRTHGTVGNPGSIAPATAMPRNSNPKVT